MSQEEYIYTAVCTAIALQSIHLFQSNCIVFSCHQASIYFVAFLYTSLASIWSFALPLHQTNHSRRRYAHEYSLRGSPPLPPLSPMRPPNPLRLGRVAKPKASALLFPKSNKANATNRVQKRTPTKRNARGYVYVDEDPDNNDTSRTASPDYISDTPSRREITETPPPSQAKLEAENARLRKELRHHRHRNHSRQRRRDDSDDDSSDTEQGDGPRVYFLHHHAGNKPFLSLHEHYPTVNIKYFKQIYWGTFQPSKSMRLAHDALAWSTTPKGKKDKDDVTPESSNMVQLLRCFEVYGYAICFFTARPHVALQLHDALVRYRLRLMDFSLHFTFVSIRTYHYAFMAKRMLSRQDDPVAWLSEDYECQHYLVIKTSQQLQANLPGRPSASGGYQTPASGGFLSCNRFNAGDCNRTNCKYPHICSACQHGNHPARECKSRQVASNSNSVPLGSRITAP